MFKTMLAEFRDSLNHDYVRLVLHDKRHLPFRERWRLVWETREHRTDRIRWAWVVIVELTPVLALALVDARTHLLDHNAPLAVVIPIIVVYTLIAFACGWRIGSLRARRALAQQAAAQRGQFS